MKKILNTFILFLSFFLIISSNIFLINAEESDIDITTSNVKDDLASMNLDSISNLSENENIFIAMSQYYDSNNSLRSYVYINLITPNIKNNLVIILSTSLMNENYSIVEDYSTYKLNYINSYSTWFKFEIKDLPNLTDTTRRYKIDEIGFTNDSFSEYTSILSIDDVFIFNGIENNSIEVFREDIETITITDKEISFYCYGDSDNFLFSETDLMEPGDFYTDAWYVFFNTDKKIDKLLEVELTYTQFNYHFYRCSIGMNTAITENYINNLKNSEGSIYQRDFNSGDSYVTYLDPIRTIISAGTNKVSYSDKGWFGKYDMYYEEIDNIMDLKSYQSKVGDTFVFDNFADKYDWGVNFKNTKKSFEEYDSSLQLPVMLNTEGSSMTDVAILRLKFKTSGIVHNCYAVDQPNSDFTGNSADVNSDLESSLKKFKELFNEFNEILSILLLIIPIIILIICIPGALNVIIFIVSLPIKLIKSIFKKKPKN